MNTPHFALRLKPWRKRQLKATAKRLHLSMTDVIERGIWLVELAAKWQAKDHHLFVVRESDKKPVLRVVVGEGP